MSENPSNLYECIGNYLLTLEAEAVFLGGVTALYTALVLSAIEQHLETTEATSAAAVERVLTESDIPCQN